MGDVRFGSTEHLAYEVVAAYVDGELRMTAYMRAAEHLAACGECASNVEAQQQARRALRHAAQVSIPSALLCALTKIPGEQARCAVPPPRRRKIGYESSSPRRWPLRWRW